MIAIQLKTEQLINPIGIDVVKPRLSWVCSGDKMQTGYEIVVTEKEKLLFTSGFVASNVSWIEVDLDYKSRQRITWKVRLWNEDEQVGDWSEEAFFEMAFLQKEDWCAKWILPELPLTEVLDNQLHKPASYLKKHFDIEAFDKGRLYVTAHGLYEAYLNGVRIGNFILAPGVSTYDKKLHYQTYDITSLLQTGNNEICVTLGDGWYRSCSGVSGERNFFGEDIALLFQLEVDGRVVCISDESWLATQDGPLRENDMQQGEVYDARKETGIYNSECFWHPVRIGDFDYDPFGLEGVSCSNSVPILENEHFSGILITTPNGEQVIDYSQNLAGYIEFTLQAHEGDRIIMYHGENLDENGNFTAENFQERERHVEGGILQRVEYICKEGINHYKSAFTLWGFRYAKVETTIDLSNSSFTAIAVYSHMGSFSTFECSDANVNQLVKNSVWSMKSNFCDIPTDCPTRERAAWTGDAGVFVETGIYMAENYTLFRKWLGECRLNQTEEGKVVNIAPPNQKPSMFTAILSGSVGWGDACIIVPYTLYKRYQDPRVLTENYEMMEKWYDFLLRRASEKSEADLIFKNNPYSKYTIETGVDYGEWCEPGVNPQLAMRTPQYKVATAYLAYSGRLLSEISKVLGKEEEATRYAYISDQARNAYRYVALQQGRIVSERQAEYIQAIQFGLLTEEEARQAAKDLNKNVIDHNYHLNTGFLSTPFLCEVLAKYGYVETAYRLLLQDTMPSWLYAVKKGATTIWETWDGIDEVGKVKASLNHYSYGAIVGWLYKGVCGIHLENGQVQIKPLPHPLLKHAKALYHSPVGVIGSEWNYTDNGIVYSISIPSNVTAEVSLPDGRIMQLTSGVHQL